jgi:hypothetical protein
MRYSAVRFVANLLPSGEPLVDVNLIELLTNKVEPDEEGALCFAPQAAAWLARYRRDPFDHLDGARNQVYRWLRSLPERLFREIRGSLVTAGRVVAERGDPWCTYHFAAIFAYFGDFSAEADVLGLAKRSLPEGRRNERLIQNLGELEQAAKVNDQLARE